jgi:ElaB/YqjD/DUF883 family membrane-anchored ribosome-binding protein
MAQAPSELENSEMVRADRANSSGLSDKLSPSERRELEMNTGEPPLETEHIKGQIEETRHQMGETIDAIQDRLSFSNISDQVSEHVNNAVETAKEAVYDATIGKAVYFMKNIGNEISGSSMVRTAKDNPLPFILLGLGAGMLVYQGFSGKGRRVPARRFDRSPDQLRSRATDPSAVNRDNGPGLVDKVSGVAGSAFESVSETLGTVKSSAEEYANQAFDKAGQMRIKAADTYDQYLNERPLALGAIAMALGAAVGMAIPSTQYEAELMGEAREDLLQKAQDTASQLLDKTKNVMNETGRAIKDETKNLAG